MPSKMTSKKVTSCVSVGDCLGVCRKSCKISKISYPLGSLPSDTAELCMSRESESPDTTFASCKAGSYNEDGYESELASDAVVFQKSTSQVDLHQFNERTEILLDSTESYLKTANHAAADRDGIYRLASVHSNSGDDGHLDVPQFENSEDHKRISDAIDCGNVTPGDGKSRNNDSSEINIHSTNVVEQDILIQGDEDALISSVYKEREDTKSLSYTDICDGDLANSDDSWLGLDLQFEVHRQEYEFEPFFLDSESMAALGSDFFNDLPSLLDSECTTWLSSSPKDTSAEKPVTLVLDLDETLVHTTASPCDGSDFSFQMEKRVLYVKKRPFLHTFLERVGELFRIIIFTAGTKNYADHVLDMLDPGRRLTSRRAYRDSCIFSDNSYTKDLTVLGVNLAKLAIVDNTPAVFHELQVNNGIPIKSWLGDPTDRELLSLLPFLEILAGADDVRPFIAEKFRSTGSP